MLCLPLPLWRHAHVFRRASNLVRFTSSGFTSTLCQTFVVHRRARDGIDQTSRSRSVYASQDARAAIPRNPSRPQLCHLQFLTLRTLTHIPRCDVKSSNRSVPSARLHSWVILVKHVKRSASSSPLHCVALTSCGCNARTPLLQKVRHHPSQRLGRFIEQRYLVRAHANPFPVPRERMGGRFCDRSQID